MKKILIFIFFILSLAVYAHPHVFFESDFTLKISTNKIEKIKIHLILDEMSTLLYKDEIFLDKSGNIEKNSINFLKDVQKHIHLCLNNLDLKKEFVFKNVYFQEENLILNLEIPINIKIKNGDKLIFSFYDDEYYYTYEYEKYNLNIEKTKDISIKINFLENRKKKFYYGLISPMEYEVIFQ